MQLSPFQKEKFEYYFRFFDINKRGALTMEDLPAFMERIRDYTGWDEHSTEARECYEIHSTFFEVLFEKAGQEVQTGSISMKEWLNMWAGLLPGCKGMNQFPIWLRLLPKSLFKIIDRDGDSLIGMYELVMFYEAIVGLDPDKAMESGRDAYCQMTDNGRYPLNIDGYEQIFANFLIGRTPYGPGRFIFGCFEHKVMPFTLIAPPEPNPEDEEIESRTPRGLNRRRSSGAVRKPNVVFRQ